MPATNEELEATIQDNMVQASSILLLNQNVLAEYEMRQSKIEALTKTLEEEEKGLHTHLAEIEALKSSWLPTLCNLVSQINITFSRNFQEMAVAGEVSLDERDMDFGAYGIIIKVKFRLGYLNSAESLRNVFKWNVELSKVVLLRVFPFVFC